VLAEDHATMRRSLRQLLDGEPDIEVVGEVDALPAAIAAVERTHPEVLVLDLRTPDGSNIDSVRRMRTHAPATKVVVITMHEAKAFARQAHEAGAVGFVLKDTADVELPEAVRRAARDEVYTSPRVVSRVPPLP
jgi:DNA-binding NarL/FixJ family response regulator